MGGDEFIILTSLTPFDTPATLENYGQQIAQTLNQTVVVGGQRAKLGASIGIAIHDGLLGVDNFISLADEAMYEAKRRGGGAHISPASVALYAKRHAS